MRRRQQLTPKLLGRTHVDPCPGTTSGPLNDLFSEDTELGALGTDLEGLRGPCGGVLSKEPALELPLLASTVEQLHVLDAPVLEQPVGVGCKPVVVASVQ